MNKNEKLIEDEDIKISKIKDINADTEKIYIEAVLLNYDFIQHNNSIYTILNLKDDTGTINVLDADYIEDNYFIDLKEKISEKYYTLEYSKFIMELSPIIIDEKHKKHFKNIFKGKTILDNLKIGDKFFLLKGIKYVGKEFQKDYDEPLHFGTHVYDLDIMNIEDKYNFINTNTYYLNNIKLDEIKDIQFNYYKDIIILLKNGDLIINGNKKFNNIFLLINLDVANICYAITNDNKIKLITGFKNSNDITLIDLLNNKIEDYIFDMVMYLLKYENLLILYDGKSLVEFGDNENKKSIILFTDETQIKDIKYTKINKIKLDEVIEHIYNLGNYNSIIINPYTQNFIMDSRIIEIYDEITK